VRVAFHFDAGHFGVVYGPPSTTLLFRAIVACIREERRDLLVRRGDLAVWAFHGGAQAFARRLFACPRDIWSTLTEASVVAMLTERNVWVLAVEGLSLDDVNCVQSNLEASDGYLGAVEIHLANEVHWAFYDRKLVAAYRIVADELRLLTTTPMLDPEARDDGRLREWANVGIFSRVEWEDFGLNDTVFDDLSSFDRAKRIAEIEDTIQDSVGPLISVVLMRLAVLDPQLSDGLHASLDALERAQSVEQLAQASLSCRRFLGQLADVLYPPRSTKVNGRKVGPQEVRNRLWAYVKETLEGTQRQDREAVVEGLGKRLDVIDELANKHIHGADATREAVQLLTRKTVVWAHDVLQLTPPPRAARIDPHHGALLRFGELLMRRQRASPDGELPD
jgi:hypothetical protein